MLLITLILGNTFVNMLLPLFLTEIVSRTHAIIISTILVLFIGEYLP